MIGIDTNLRVRVFGADDQHQTDAGVRLLDLDAGEDGAFVNLIVLAEFASVKRRSYTWDSKHIRDALDAAKIKMERSRSNRETILLPICEVSSI